MAKGDTYTIELVVDQKAQAELIVIAENVASFAEKHLSGSEKLAKVHLRLELLLAELLQGVIKISDGAGNIAPIEVKHSSA